MWAAASGCRSTVVVLPVSRLSLVGAAFGPGRPGLQRCCQGGLDCVASDRVRGQEAERAWYLVEMDYGRGRFLLWTDS